MRRYIRIIITTSSSFQDSYHRGPYNLLTPTNSLSTITLTSNQGCVREIAALPGVDCLLIGPFDLGNNIGHPILGEMHDELKAAINSIKDAAHAEGKKVGFYCTTGEQCRQYAEDGFDFISIQSDMAAVQNYFTETLAVATGKVQGKGEGKEMKGYDGR